MSYPRTIPAFQTSLIMPPPRPSKGRSREASRRRDEVRRLRASSQRGTRAAAELPPGPLGVPARSWLTARSAHSMRDGPDESRARCRKTSAIGAPQGARVPQGTSHKDFALFGAPSPLTPRTRTRRGKETACLVRAPQQTPSYRRKPVSSAEAQCRHNKLRRWGRGLEIESWARARYQTCYDLDLGPQRRHAAGKRP